MCNMSKLDVESFIYTFVLTPPPPPPELKKNSFWNDDYCVYIGPNVSTDFNVIWYVDILKSIMSKLVISNSKIGLKKKLHKNHKIMIFF